MDLSKYAGSFENRKPVEQKTDFAVIPDGVYKAAITNTTWKMEKDPPAFHIEYTIQEGEFAKRKVFNFYKLDDTSLGFLEKDTNHLGKTFPTDVNQLPDFVETLVGCECEIYVKGRQWEGKQYYNAYINAPERPDLKNYADDIKAGGSVAPKFDKDEELPF